MFWDSVLSGLGVLLYWETYVAGLIYIAIFLIPMIVVGMIMEKSESGGAVAGCLSMILLPVIQMIALTVFVLILAPIIFGYSEDAAWRLPWGVLTLAPGAFFKLVGTLVIAAIVLAFIPILGQLHSLQTLVLGGIALVFVLGILESIDPGIVKGRVDFIPSFWFSLGLLVIGGFMSWIGVMVSALIGASLEMAEEGLGQLIVTPITAVFGFIPLFMYGAWLGAQVKNGL